MRCIKYFAIVTLALLTGCSKSTMRNTSRAIDTKELGQLAEVNFCEATKQYAIDNYSEAKVWYQKTLAIDKNIAAAHYMLGKIYVTEKNLPEAISHSEEAVKLGSKNRHYYHQLAQLYERQQNFKEASATYIKLISEVPNSEEFYYELATNYIFLQNYNEATNTYSKIEQVFGKTLELTRQKQQLFLKMNKLQQAIDEGNAYLKEFPDDVDMKITQAEILYTNNKGEEAINYLEKIIIQHPTNGEAHLLLMNIYKAKGDQLKYQKQLDYVFSTNDVSAEMKVLVLREMATDPNDETRKSASQYGELAVKQHPRDAKLLETFGDLLMVEKKKNEASAAYSKATKLLPNDFNIWVKLLQTDAELNRTDSMIIHSENAISYFPNQGLFWMFGGTAFQLKKQCDKAIGWLEEAKKLSVGNDNIVLESNSRLGDCYNDTKQYEKSNKAYEDALKVDRNNDYVLNNYSYYLSLRKENLSLAKEMSEKLIKRHPYEANYLDTHAWVLYMLKDYEGAKRVLEVAVANSANGTIVEHYGDVLFKLGNKAEAVAQWNKAKKLGETTPLIDKKITDQTLYEE